MNLNMNMFWPRLGVWLDQAALNLLAINLSKTVAVIILAWFAQKVGGWVLGRLLAKKFITSRFPVESLQAVVLKIWRFSVYLLAVVAVLAIFQIRLVNPQDLQLYTAKLVKAFIILFVSGFILRLGGFLIEQTFARSKEGKGLLEERRAHTLSTLLQSVLTYLVYFIAGLMILEDIFGVNTRAILAGAGVVGLAVGFGAQNLVRDIITGFFILFEDQFRVGEYISTGGVTGVVEEMGLRTTRIREWTGQYHIIPNGEITKVTNYDRGEMLAIVEIGIAYEEDIDRAIAVMQETGAAMAREVEAVVEDPVVMGVVGLDDSQVLIRVAAKAMPGQQWGVERELRKRLKQAFDAHGIEIPYPRQVLLYPGDYRLPGDEGKETGTETRTDTKTDTGKQREGSR